MWSSQLMRKTPWPGVLGAATIACFAGTAHAQTRIQTAVPKSIIVPAMNDSTFSRYASGWECARAGKWWTDQILRDKRRDTIAVPPDGNPPPARSVAATRACLARLNTANTIAVDLLGLIEALLAANEDTQAEDASLRLVQSVAAASDSVKAWTLSQIVDLHMMASQPRLTSAVRYAAQLDAMGPAAAPGRMLAHTAIAKGAHQRDSVVLWQRELNAALSASQAMVGDDRRVYADASADVYVGIAELKARLNDPAGAMTSISTGRTTLTPLRPAVAEQRFYQMESFYAPIGQPVFPITATKWFNTNGGDGAPVKGKAALIAFVSQNCGSNCYSTYATLHRLLAKYGPQGLGLTLLARTEGYVRGELATPDAEMMAVSDFFTKHLGFRVPLGVWQTTTSTRADGHIVIESRPQSELSRRVGFVYLVDTEGKIRIISPLSSEYEASLGNVIAETLGIRPKGA